MFFSLRTQSFADGYDLDVFFKKKSEVDWFLLLPSE
jgi:hypothetical protein